MITFYEFLKRKSRENYYDTHPHMSEYPEDLSKDPKYGYVDHQDYIDRLKNSEIVGMIDEWNEFNRKAVEEEQKKKYTTMDEDD